MIILDFEYQNDSDRVIQSGPRSLETPFELFGLFVVLLMKIYRFNYFHYVFGFMFVHLFLEY